jgi:hypothetical protein
VFGRRSPADAGGGGGDDDGMTADDDKVHHHSHHHHQHQHQHQQHTANNVSDSQTRQETVIAQTDCTLLTVVR